MSNQSGEPLTARKRCRSILMATLVGAAAISAGCKPGEKAVENQAPDVPLVTATKSELIEQLAAARVDQAKTRLDQKRPGEALALLVAALKGDPASAEARSLAEAILAETVWNFPTTTIHHQLAIDQVAFAAPGSLWVSFGGDMNTTVRWDLETMQIGSVLFPASGVETRGLVFGPQERSVVIERGPVTLLCNAQTLKPILDLGPLPEFVTPAATVVFSPDGLLIAHPGFVSDSDHSIVWHLRDVATGQVLRTSDPAPSTAPQPLAAYLDRGKLRVLHADGSLLEMPVSPVEPAQTVPMPEPVILLNAQFSKDGNAVLTLVGQGAHEAPVHSIISYRDPEDGSLELKALIGRFPWSKHPNIWNGLMSDPETAPYAIVANSLKMLTGGHAPVEVDSEITSVAFDGNNAITGEQNGTLTIHRLLALPLITEAPKTSGPINPASLISLENLCESLTGIHFDEKERSFTRLKVEDRIQSFESCDFAAIEVIFPNLDFSGVREDFFPVAVAGASRARPSRGHLAPGPSGSVAGASRARPSRGHLAPGPPPEKSIHQKTPGPEAYLPLWDRLARADLSGKSWPAILKLSERLADTSWHQQLTHAVLAKAPDHPDDLTESPWLARSKMEELFRTSDNTAILTAIDQSGNKGPAAASALALALRSEHPEWIRTGLESATDLPPIVRLIAQSRIAWLEGHRAKALSPWPESFPEMKEIRRREDWEGWEQADFEPALENIRQCVQDELVAIEVPESSTMEQRKAIAERLADPETLATVGKPRFALACMNAALAFSAHKEDSETTFQLAKTARNLGAPPEPCMRAEALALTAMGDYQKAHPLWIELITEHPLETQIPGDYAEAAYTAFENADPQQAMTILTTGMHRYPEDANFALRAGWVALLTGNSERGYQFLKDGKRIGYPAEKEENAIALLTIAAAQCGSYDDATVYFNDLLRIDPAWGEFQTLDTLDWPEELKSTLGQFMH